MQSALTSVDGVAKAEVSMPDKAKVTYDKSKTSEKKLLEAVKKAGYTAAVKKDDKKKT